MKRRKTTSFSFHNASSSTTTPAATSVMISVRRAVWPISRDFSPCDELDKPVLAAPTEQICLESRRHGIVLARAFVRSFVLLACGLGLLVSGWPWSVGGAVL